MKKGILKSILIVGLLLIAGTVFALSGLLPKKNEDKKTVEIEKEQIIVADDEDVNKTINTDSNLPQPKEKYVQKVIRQFTWGDGEGQLGYHKGGECEGDLSYGPAGIFVDDEENIYILDSANSRMVKCESDGKIDLTKKIEERFVFDVIMGFYNDNIYIVDLYSPAIGVFTRKFELKNVVKRYYDPLANRPDKLKIDKNGKIFLINKWNMKTICMSPLSIKEERIVKKKEIKGVPSNLDQISIDFEHPETPKKELNINIQNHTTKSTKTFTVKSNKYISCQRLLDIDKEGNIYIKFDASKEPFSLQWKEYIYKYDRDGNFITSIILENDTIELDPTHHEGIIKCVSKDGNIYQLWLKEEGAILLKWEKEK